MGAEYTITETYPGNPLGGYSLTDKILIHDSLISASTPIRAVLVARNFFNGKKCYNEAVWREFARENHFALILFSTATGDTRSGDGNSSSYAVFEVNRLNALLAQAATRSGLSGLDSNTPFVPVGVSRGGSNSLNMAYNFTNDTSLVNNRVLAVIAYHGESVTENSNSELMPTSTVPSVPCLYCYASLDKDSVGRNPTIEHRIRLSSTGIRKATGVKWTTLMQLDFRHNTIGDSTLPLAWLKKVAAYRLPAAVGGNLNDKTWDNSSVGDYDLQVNSGADFFINKTVRAATAGDEKTDLIWFPDAEFAAWWLADAVSYPEVSLSGRGVEITDGDTTPSLTEGTDIGGVVVGGAIEHTFTIANSGAANLNLTGVPKVALSGTHVGDFTVTKNAASPVAAGDRTTFRVRFLPSANGLRTATVSIANDDADESSFEFRIHGTGIPDSDGDGLSDADETNSHGTAPNNPDSDGDGWSDYQEVMLGIDPNDAASRFTLEMRQVPSNSQHMQIQWPSHAGISYRVWQSSSLKQWSVLRNWSPAETYPTETLNVAPPSSRLFFKVEGRVWEAHSLDFKSPK